MCGGGFCKKKFHVRERIPLRALAFGCGQALVAQRRALLKIT